MMPKSQLARTVFIVLLCIAGAVLLISIGSTVWLKSGDEGRVVKAIITFTAWATTIPLFLACAVWALINFISSLSGGSQGRSTAPPQAD